jgi:hypothetical protein
LNLLLSLVLFAACVTFEQCSAPVYTRKAGFRSTDGLPA